MPTGYSVYRERPSPIHQRIDPRTKMVWLGVLFILSICFNHPLPLAILNLGVIVVIRIARIEFKELQGTLYLSLWLMLMSVFLWPAYIDEGHVLIRIGSFTVTDMALLFGLAMGLRITLMLLAATTWMITTSPQKITAGLLKIGMPYKAGLAMAAAIRFVPLMNAERLIVLEAQRARGLDLTSSNPINKLLRSSPVILPLFTRALVTARNLAVAMDARGFGARPGRTSIIELEFTDFDRLLTSLALVALVMGIVMRIFGIGVLIGNLL